jgi:hypothetical protein
LLRAHHNSLEKKKYKAIVFDQIYLKLGAVHVFFSRGRKSKRNLEVEARGRFRKEKNKAQLFTYQL